MAFLSEHDKQRIAAAVQAAEAHTSGEFVTVLARVSGDYFYYPTLWAALLALLAPGLVLFWQAALALPTILELQLALFLVLGLALRWTPVKMWLVPAAIKRRYAARRAREQFFAQRLHMTRERTGVLLFVSAAEHYVEILADEGIHARVPAGSWDSIVAGFVGQVRVGRVADGFVQAIEACGELLATHFPQPGAVENELPDRFVEL